MTKLPARSEVKNEDTWDLSRLYADGKQWEQDLEKLEKQAGSYEKYRGQLGDSSTLANCLKTDSRLSRLAERLGAFAYLRTAEDQTNSDAQRMLGRFQHVATRLGERSSFVRPEVLSLPPTKTKRMLAAPELSRFHLLLARMLRYRPHTLGASEELILAMQGEMSQAAQRSFRQLLDADMTFGDLADHRGRRQELSHATLRTFLLSPDRNVRKRAFHQYYAQIVGHENTLAAMLSGSVQRDIYYSKVRGYPSARSAALFPDRVPDRVYDNLIQTVRARLPVLFRYLELRRKKLRLRSLHQYDLEVPLFEVGRQRRTWDRAVSIVIDSLAPLGTEYCQVLEQGLRGRWCDRYPNRGKQSGAFSYGVYDGDPYILMNYKPDVLEDVFTLAHEAGHSMHSYCSVKSQPYEYYHYTIFVAEVASTFNEQLLSRYLLDRARNDEERAYLIHREIDGIRATIIRQTMFAEFEQRIHASAEAGEPLTVAALTGTYGELLRDYFGAGFVIDEDLTREGLRVPHFYRAFYVYKYATGLSAAIALSEKVKSGDESARKRYLKFLHGGCSKDPLDLLRDAGVDMEQPVAIQAALDRLEFLVDELESLV